MSSREPARCELRANVLRQAEQPNHVGDRRAIFPDRRRDRLLRQLKLVGEPSIRKRLLDRIQVFALNVFDKRHLEQRLLAARRDVAHDDRDTAEPCHLGRPPPPFARDNLKPIGDFPHDNRLNDSVRDNRAREILERGWVHDAARLKIVWRESIDVDLDRRESRFGCVGD